MKGLIVVPMHNERGSARHVLEVLKERPPLVDVLVVDDGSADGTSEILEQAGAWHVRHVVNLGYLEALRTGLTVALRKRFDFVIFFDGDGQHRVEDVAHLIEEYAADAADVIIGSRYVGGERAPGRLRHFAARAFAFVASALTRQTIHDTTSGLKLLSRRAMQLMSEMVLEDAHAELIVFMAAAGCRIREIPIHAEPRTSGVSMYRLSKALFYPVCTAYLLLLSGSGNRRRRTLQ